MSRSPRLEKKITNYIFGGIGEIGNPEIYHISVVVIDCNYSCVSDFDIWLHSFSNERNISYCSGRNRS